MSQEFLHTIQVGLFGIGVPSINTKNFFFLCVYVALGAVILIMSSCRFEKDESVARLCVLPVLGLLIIKHIYYPTAVHLTFVLVFVAPMLIVYWNWCHNSQAFARLNSSLLHTINARVVVVLALFCLMSSFHYQNQAAVLRQTMIKPFEPHTWSGLNETFITATPSDPITSRMNAVQSEIRADDKVLFLSPFDHLMSFYGNP
jgi:hypothetical protein